MPKANHPTTPAPVKTPETVPAGHQDLATRRLFLSVAAVGAALALPPVRRAAAGSAVDPIYAAIERHKDLVKPLDEVWTLRARCKDFEPMTEEEKARLLRCEDAIDEASLPLEAATGDLIDTVPTTHAGILATLRYMLIQEGNDGTHMIQGRYIAGYVDWRSAWLETLIESVAAIEQGGA